MVNGPSAHIEARGAFTDGTYARAGEYATHHIGLPEQSGEFFNFTDGKGTEASLRAAHISIVGLRQNNDRSQIRGLLTKFHIQKTIAQHFKSPLKTTVTDVLNLQLMLPCRNV